MKKRNIVAVLVLLISIGMVGFSGSQIINVERGYHEGNTAYDALRKQVRKNSPADYLPVTQQTDTGAGEVSMDEPTVFEPLSGIDYEALKTVSKDASAWLYCPDTVIDYPVMEASDYYYYLYHLPDGTQNLNGSLFIDYNCASDFSDLLTIIYGHHMKSGSMFGSLKGYKDQRYFNEHPYMYLYTQQGNYRIELIYGCVIGAGQWRERAFMYAENVDALIAYAAYNTTFESGAVYSQGDRVVALSTCSYEFDDARYVVIGILKGVDQDGTGMVNKSA